MLQSYQPHVHVQELYMRLFPFKYAKRGHLLKVQPHDPTSYKKHPTCRVC